MLSDNWPSSQAKIDAKWEYRPTDRAEPNRDRSYPITQCNTRWWLQIITILVIIIGGKRWKMCVCVCVYLVDNFIFSIFFPFSWLTSFTGHSTYRCSNSRKRNEKTKNKVFGYNADWDSFSTLSSTICMDAWGLLYLFIMMMITEKMKEKKRKIGKWENIQRERTNENIYLKRTNENTRFFTKRNTWSKVRERERKVKREKIWWFFLSLTWLLLLFHLGFNFRN